MKYNQISAGVVSKFEIDSSTSFNSEEVKPRLFAMVELAMIAGSISSEIYKKVRRGEQNLGLEDKGDREEGYSSPLTMADTLVHEATIKAYRAKFPEDTFEGEEGRAANNEAKYVIVQDEIDGTQNFAVGSGGYSYVSALYERGTENTHDLHLASLVCDPLNRALFMAVKGSGAFRIEYDESQTKVTHARPIQVANLDVRTATTPPYIMMDTMGLGEDPILRMTLQKLGYKVEPQSGSGLKVAVVSSESVVSGMFRSQRGNPDPGDIAAASLLVTEGRANNDDNYGLATSLSGGSILNQERKFYDGYAIGAPLTHAHIVAANLEVNRALANIGKDQSELSPSEWAVIAAEAANSIKASW